MVEKVSFEFLKLIFKFYMEINFRLFWCYFWDCIEGFFYSILFIFWCYFEVVLRGFYVVLFVFLIIFFGIECELSGRLFLFLVLFLV